MKTYRVKHLMVAVALIAVTCYVLVLNQRFESLMASGAPRVSAVRDPNAARAAPPVQKFLELRRRHQAEAAEQRRSIRESIEIIGRIEGEDWKRERLR